MSSEFRRNRTGRDVKPLGIGGKLFVSLFFGLVLGLGLLFVAWIGRGFVLDVATYRWQPADAVVLESVVQDTGDDDARYRLAIAYRYRVDGDEYVATRVARGYRGSSDYTDAQKLLEAYPAGASIRCWVDPDRPAEATLRRNGPWQGFLALFPAVFVVIGAGGIVLVWRRGDRRPAESTTVAISSTVRPRRRAAAILVFFLLFAAAGGVATWFLLVRPAVALLAARGWHETPCEVVSSRVRAHDGDDGTTYSIDILYAYTFDGRQYRSNRYDFLGGSSSGYDRKRAVVERHPPGTRTVCYVDPEQPAAAVLVRDLRPKYLIGGVPLLFAVVGVIGSAHALRKMSGGKSTVRDAAVGSAPQPEPPSGEIVLEPTITPMGKLLAIVAFSAVWNGVLAVFLAQIADDWRRGASPWFTTLILVPFVLVGLLSVGLAVYQALALANPRARLTVRAPRIEPGIPVRVDWNVNGRVERLSRLSVRLEGSEEAKYTRGTDTCTDRETFHAMTLAETDSPLQLAGGGTTLVIPEDSMHSFTAPHNRIVWTLRVHGEIRSWPDFQEDFELPVRPRSLDGATA